MNIKIIIKLSLLTIIFCAPFFLIPRFSFAQFCGGPGSYSCCTQWVNSCYRYVNGNLIACPPSQSGINGCSCGTAYCAPGAITTGTCPGSCSPCITGDGNQNSCTYVTGGGPPPPPPPPPPPTYDVTGYVFKDLNENNTKNSDDVGVSGRTITMAGYTEITNSNGYYNQYDFYEGNYTVSVSGAVCGWNYPVTSKPVSLFGGNRVVNFSLYPNDATDIVPQRFELRDVNGVEKNAFDSGEKVYVYLSSRNIGNYQPWSSSGNIQGSIHRNHPNPFGNAIDVAEATDPDNFIFQRNLCWNPDTQWRIGSYPGGGGGENQSAFINRKDFTVNSAPGSYTARVYLDFANTVKEPGGQNVTANQMTYPYTVRGYTIQGSVFIDIDGDGNKDPVVDVNYTGSIPSTAITDTLGGVTQSTPSRTNGNYEFLNRRAGVHTIRYSPPSGWKATHPTGAYSINFANGGSTTTPCVSATLPQGPTCTINNNTTVINVNFGISQATTWMQNYGLNARFDQGPPMSVIPATANSTFGAFAMRPFGRTITTPTITAPGLLITGNETYTFTPGAVSAAPFGWKAGGNTNTTKEILNPTQLPLKTSYTYLSEKLANTAKELKGTTGACSDYSNCQLLSTLPPGVYKVTLTPPETALDLRGYTVPTGNYTILVNGSVAILGSITVNAGSSFLLSTANDIAVRNNIGRTPQTYTNTRAGSAGGIEGFYSADGDFRLNSRGTCAQQAADTNPDDYQFYVDGSITVNAAGKGGKLDIQRTLCNGNLTYPTLIVRPRLDLILTAPENIKQSNYVWQEIAP